MLKKILLGTLVVIALFLTGVYGAYKIFYPGNKVDFKRTVEVAGEDKFVAVGRTNIAVMGIDERSDDEGRTDTLFVVMYDPVNEKIALLSVPRDSRVRIPRHGFDKANHAYNYGGASATVRTLENLLGIQIDHYVKVDLKGFERMVDAIGGVDIDVEKRMYYEDPWDGEDGFVIDLSPGMQTLSGKQAIQYVRYRDEDGDIGRIVRQQTFLNAVYEKMSSPFMLAKIPSLVKVAIDSVTTDMGAADMVQIGKTFQKNSKAGLHKMSVPGEPVYIDEINYWLPDIVAVRSEIAEVLGLEATDKFMASARTLAQVYQDSLPANVERDGVIGTEEKVVAATPTKKTTDKDGDKKLPKTANKDEKKGVTAPGGKPTDKGKPLPENNGKDMQMAPPVKPTPPAPVKPPDKPSEKSSDKAPVNLPQPVAPPDQPAKAKVLRASVINCSGNPDAGRKMESLLESNGISVVSIFSGATQSTSSIVSSTHDGWVVSKLSALPFRYSLRIAKDGGGSVEAVVYIGQDFAGNR